MTLPILRRLFLLPLQPLPTLLQPCRRIYRHLLPLPLPLNVEAMAPLPCVTVRHGNDARIALCFSYEFNGSKVRVFNMDRGETEALATVLLRIQTNVLKHLNRSCYSKKKKKKRDDLQGEPPPETDAVDDCDVRLLRSDIALDAGITTSADLRDFQLSEVCGATTACLEAFVTGASHHVLRIRTQHYALDVNPPVVEAMSLPSNIMAGFLVYPNYLDIMHADLDDCLVQWSVSCDYFENYEVARARVKTIKWAELEHEGFLLKTSEEMIGKLLKVVVTPAVGHRRGQQYEAVSRGLVSSPPPSRPYQERHRHTESAAPTNSVRVLCYNLLADTYASTDFSAEHLFRTCPPAALDGFYRKQLIIDEILGYKADVLCLQEVDADLFTYDLSRVLLKAAFLEGLYAGKRSTSTKEGAATFWNTSKFRLLESEEYGISEEMANNPALQRVWEAVQLRPALMERVCTRNTVLQVCVLERLCVSSAIPSLGVDATGTASTAADIGATCLTDGSGPASDAVKYTGKDVLVVCNTHLYFHPDADHIRLLQAGVCCELIQQVVRRLEEQGARVSALFCGDLNSTPDTGVYSLATEGSVGSDHPGWRADSEQTVESVSFEHGLRLSSACGCPAYTNYTADFNGCLDWIFYQTDRFTVDKVVELPSHAVVTAHVALPSPVIPSDHLALVAELGFKR